MGVIVVLVHVSLNLPKHVTNQVPRIAMVKRYVKNTSVMAVLQQISHQGDLYERVEQTKSVRLRWEYWQQELSVGRKFLLLHKQKCLAEQLLR